MYLVEIHGKLSKDNENKEDILTSNVFSFFKYANREVFLFEFIKMIGLGISVPDAMDAEFHFWPTFEDKTEPDLVLVVGKYYLLFETKYHSGFGKETQDKKHQVVREIEGGKYEAQNMGKEFKIIAITAHYSDKPEIKKDIPKEYLEDLIWINWQSITYMVYQLVEKNPSLPFGIRFFATDLYELLVRKKLRNYEGLSSLMINFKTLNNNIDYVFFKANSSNYRGKFVGFMNVLPNYSLDMLLTDYIFFHVQREFFCALLPSQMIIQPADTLFHRRSGYE